MPLADINGIRLQYERAGTGAGVVYIHGGFASLASRLTPPEEYAWTWEQAFCADFDFIEYERRGCYRSDCPEDGYDLPTQAADLVGLLDHLHLDSAHLIGSSAGGPVAVVFAAIWPQRVRSLTLAGTTLDLFGQPGDAITPVIRDLFAMLKRDGPQAAFAARPAGVEVSFGVLWEQAEMKQRGTLEEYLARQARLNQCALGLPLEVRLRHYAAELRSMGAYIDFDLRPYARRVKAPTLVVHGTHDREVPLSQGADLARAIGGARFITLEGEGHSLILRSRKAQEIVRNTIQAMEGGPP